MSPKELYETLTRWEGLVLLAQRGDPELDGRVRLGQLGEEIGAARREAEREVEVLARVEAHLAKSMESG